MKKQTIELSNKDYILLSNFAKGWRMKKASLARLFIHKQLKDQIRIDERAEKQANAESKRFERRPRQ